MGYLNIFKEIAQKDDISILTVSVIYFYSKNALRESRSKHNLNSRLMFWFTLK